MNHKKVSDCGFHFDFKLCQQTHLSMPTKNWDEESSDDDNENFDDDKEVGVDASTVVHSRKKKRQ